MAKLRKKLCYCMLLFWVLPVYAIETKPYASLRLQAEYVEPDNKPDNFNDYAALRDAYSRIGLKLSHPFNNEWSAFSQIEIALDLANLDIQGPWDQDEALRIFKLGFNSPIGSLWYGRGWLAYYNQIAYPVDYFGSYYSGFATFATFRLNDALYYTSPEFKGVQFSVLTSKDNGATDDNRNQYTLSYARDGLTLAAAVDDQGGSNKTKIFGFSASYTQAAWYLAAKYERFFSDLNNNGYGSDGTDAVNALVQYSVGKHTLRAMLADVDNYGEFVFHAGWDFNYKENTKFFLEYYQEQETAAIADARKTTSSGSNSVPADSGGRSLVIGMRYDF